MLEIVGAFVGTACVVDGGMPRSRPVLPGQIGMAGRRTTRRTFLLRPDPSGESQRLFLYLLAVCAADHGIRVHCVVVMATHYHLVYTDARGVFPKFTAALHRALAMTVKHYRRWDEEVWNKSQTSRVLLETDAAIVQECAYAICNPVEAGIVDRPGRYPGVLTTAEMIGEHVYELERPDNAWLVSETCWPQTAQLAIEMPQALIGADGVKGGQARIQSAVDACLERVRADRKQRGVGYVGAKRSMQVAVETRSSELEPRGDRNPTFAVGRGQPKSVLEAVLAKLTAWDGAYRARMARWREGDRTSLWPAGTWKMRVVHGAAVEPAPEWNPLE